MISKHKLMSLIAIGNPVQDILNDVTEEEVTKYELEFGGTVFANKANIGIFECLEKKPNVSYLPGGSIQNALRVASWCLENNQRKEDKFKLTMLGCVGNDDYKTKIVSALEEAGVSTLLQTNDEFQTSRCAVAIYDKERCLVPEIIASNKLEMKFVDEQMENITQHDVLLIEGYFLIEKFDIVKKLANAFQSENKKIMFTLSATFLLRNIPDKMIEIANQSDLIFGNIEEAEILAEGKGETFQDTIIKIHKKLKKRDRLLVITCGNKGVFASKYDYDIDFLDFFIQSFATFIPEKEIIDLNGAGDAFLGGFISQWMQGKNLETCCKIGNNASGAIIRNIGCSFSFSQLEAVKKK